MEITVNGGHTEAMIEAEAQACLSRSSLPITLGDVMELHRLQSPFLLGGDLTDGDLWEAYRLLKERWHTDAIHHRILSGSDFTEEGDWDALATETLGLFARDLVDALATAWRAWEIIAPLEDMSRRKPHEQSEVRMYSPEWMADIICRACHAMPSLTYEQCLYSVPLVMLVHLGNAEYRYNGGRTLRDHGEREAIAILKRMQEERRRKEASQE